jgi:hypothetical protein
VVGAALAAAVTLVPRAAHAVVCSGRPTDAGGFLGYDYGTDVVKTYDTALVRVHYAATGHHAPHPASTRPDGVPDTVAFAGDTGQDALTRYAQMGFLSPPADTPCASNGGDEKLDIYLVSFAGADGSTTPENCSGAVCGSFVLAESTFDGRGYATAQEGFKTVITHELFHAVQNAYDSQLDRFWAEGSAQWAMKTLHPELPDFENQLPDFFAHPDHSLDSLPSGAVAGYLYGSAVWPLFLTLTQGDGTVKGILELEAGGKKKAMDATNAYLATKGSSVGQAFTLFSAWNAATKSPVPVAGEGYPNAAAYPGVKKAALADGVMGITSGYSSYAYTGTLNGPTTVALTTDATRNAGLLVPLLGGKADLKNAKSLPATASGDVLVIVAGITSKKTDGPFTISLAAAADGDAGPDASPTTGGGGSGGGCATSPREPSSFAGASAFTLVLGAGIFLRIQRRRRNAQQR